MCVVERFEFQPRRTFGRLLADGAFLCFTLEDQVRDGQKVPGETAIPTGTYPLVVTLSNRFKRNLPLVVGVPGFEGIRLHAGNTISDTEGCILVGLTRDDTSVYQSRLALLLVMTRLENAIARGETCELVVTNLAPTSELTA